MTDLSPGSVSGGAASSLVHLSDGDLIAAAKRQENAAIEALMRRYNRRLFRAARGVLRDDAAAEDAVQECYVRAFMNLDRYQPIGPFGAWLTRIVINEALMLKRRTRHTFVSLDDVDVELFEDETDAADALTTADATQATSAKQLLELAIDSLPQEFRVVFMLRVVEQLSIAETAACLELNQATVKTRLHRAQVRLRNTITRRLQRERLTLFEFGGLTCDRIVAHVLVRLSAPHIKSATLVTTSLLPS
ncbi:MAG: RNA polymerase sigma factor [Povalibacter sp.]